MTPLQRSTLEVLAEARKGMLLHKIANSMRQKTGQDVYAPSIAGAFGNRRLWLESDSGRVNDRSYITISDAGHAALVEENERREAAHPMGPVQPGRFFVFIEETHVVKRHTMIVRNVADQTEAEAVARAQCEDGMYPQTMSVSIDRRYVVKPVRKGHGA